MNITTDIKAKVFAQYLGQQLNLKGISEIERKYFKCTPSTIDHIFSNQYDYENCTLTLKPISAITDEDALDVSNIAGGASHLSKESQIHQAKELLTDVFLFTKQTNIVGVSWFGISQYLQSKGYDLPHYLLGGKTLHESGLAIYES